MSTLSIYLTFDGNCEEAFLFYRSVFGGEFESFQRFSEMTQDGVPEMTPEEANKMMHVSLQVSDGHVLMGSDTGGAWASSFQAGNNFSISLNANDVEETEKLFNALVKGGQITNPLDKTFWGSYFGMLTDKFGISWMVNCNLEEHK